MPGAIKHGDTFRSQKTPEWVCWANIVQRCRNPKNPGWCRYGGRGITICSRWTGLNGYSNFLNDMGRRPSPKHQIDRYPDNNGNYEPGNCRWATRAENIRNTRRNRIIDFNGVTACLTDHARAFGLDEHTVYLRIVKLGWTPQKALQTPIRHRKPRLIGYQGKMHTVSDWSRLTGIKRKTISMRIDRYGWTVERALCTPVP